MARTRGQLILLFICLTLGHHSLCVAQQDQDAPDLEFLEFLGEWETNDGEWLDPTSLLIDASVGLGEQSNTAVKTQNRRSQKQERQRRRKQDR